MGARGLEPPNLCAAPSGLGCEPSFCLYLQMGSRKLELQTSQKMGARGLEPPNLTDVNRAL